MAKKDKAQPTDPSEMGRRQQIVATYKMTKQTDKRIGLWMLGSFLLFGALGFGLFYILPGSGTIGLVIAIVGGLMLGLLAMMIVFSRRAQRTAYDRMAGQPGAAASALTLLKRGWKSDPVIAFTKLQGLVSGAPVTPRSMAVRPFASSAMARYGLPNSSSHAFNSSGLSFHARP